MGIRCREEEEVLFIGTYAAFDLEELRKHTKVGYQFYRHTFWDTLNKKRWFYLLAGSFQDG